MANRITYKPVYSEEVGHNEKSNNYCVVYGSRQWIIHPKMDKMGKVHYGKLAFMHHQGAVALACTPELWLYVLVQPLYQSKLYWNFHEAKNTIISFGIITCLVKRW